ncbi:UNVERIFIED_CONTAM: hypothetical protein PYX00_004300 [Menopon gallinae]|uniref:PAS domain-containing protein n=1 Tax=Menopon gallinae TaxID=328185 RepID=A0AAW2I3M0_9NEOP
MLLHSGTTFRIVKQWEDTVKIARPPRFHCTPLLLTDFLNDRQPKSVAISQNRRRDRGGCVGPRTNLWTDARPARDLQYRQVSWGQPLYRFLSTSDLPFSVADRSFLVANAQPGSCHIIYCSDGFCKMSGFSRAEVIGRPAVCEFLHGPLTSQLAVQTVKQAFNSYVEKHQQILYYRKDGECLYYYFFTV